MPRTIDKAESRRPSSRAIRSTQCAEAAPVSVKSDCVMPVPDTLPGWLQSLEDNTDQLFSSLCDLFGKLDPVTEPDPDGGSDDGAGVVAQLPYYVERVRTLDARIRAMRDSVRDVTSRSLL